MFKIPNWDDGLSKDSKSDFYGKQTRTKKRNISQTQNINSGATSPSVKKKRKTENLPTIHHESPVNKEFPKIAFPIINASKTLKRKKMVPPNKTKPKRLSKQILKDEVGSMEKYDTNNKTDKKVVRVLEKVSVDNNTGTNNVKRKITKRRSQKDLQLHEKNDQTKGSNKKVKVQAVKTGKVSNNKIKKLNVTLKSKDSTLSEVKDNESTTNIDECKDVNTVGLNNNIEPKKKFLDHRKEKLKLMLQEFKDPQRNLSTHEKAKGSLRERMLEKLKAAQFRMLNEKLYTSTGAESQQMFQADPEAFQVYHRGFQQQLKKWQFNPLDVIVKKIMKMPKSHVIADMGCGEAMLAKRVPHTVHSFDLVAAPGVRACDMARTPLPASSVHAAVYCLALMGTELTKYVLEANRILKIGGQLLIAEVESRFDDAAAFARGVEQLGFRLARLDASRRVFHFLDFHKTRDARRGRLPELRLRPCVYAKRAPAAPGAQGAHGASEGGKRRIKRK